MNAKNDEKIKYKFGIRNYNFLFSEVKSKKIDNMIRKYYSQLKLKELKINFLQKRLKFIEKVKHFYFQEEYIAQAIQWLTCDIGNEEYEKIVEELTKQNSIVKEIKENNGITMIKTTFGEIKFSKINNFLPELEVDEKLKSIENRKGDCHFYAIMYSKKLRNIGIENDIVTGNKYTITDKSKYLHSWNEFEINRQNIVLDYTWNVVMNKDGYYALNHINNIVSRVNYVDIEKDLPIFSQLGISMKTYLSFRDEIMKDIQKNIDIFDKER